MGIDRYRKSLFPATASERVSISLAKCLPGGKIVGTELGNVDRNGLHVQSAAIFYISGLDLCFMTSNPLERGCRGGLLQGSFLEVSLALVGVASPAYFQ
jgi:hypothetical protein